MIVLIIDWELAGEEMSRLNVCESIGSLSGVGGREHERSRATPRLYEFLEREEEAVRRTNRR